MSFKPDTNYVDDTPHEPKRFELCIVDADTILHQAAAMLQQSYVNVKHKASGNIKRFNNITEFGIRNGKIISYNPEEDKEKEDKASSNGKEFKWLAKTNYTRSLKGQSELSVSDFEIEQCAEIKPEFVDIDDALDNGLSSIGYSIGTIKKFSDSEDYKLVISGGNGNYRKQEAKTLKYKGNRTDKPILYSELREAMCNQYGAKMLFADDCEAEDVCGWYAKKEEERVGDDFDKWRVCISFIDKDVEHVYAPSFNYFHPEQGFRFPTKLECEKCLVTQIVCGDEACDNIKGLPNLTKEVTDKYGMRKAIGCGKQTALNLLEHAEDEKEMYTRAVFAYQSYYGMEPVTFEDWQGNEVTWTWLDFMQETSILVKMQEYEGQLWKVEDKLKELGINYKDELFKVVKPKLKSNEEVDAILSKLAVDIDEYIDLAAPKKAEKKDLQIERLELAVSNLKAVQDVIGCLYES